MNARDETPVAPYVLRETREGVVTLTLNRGERYNPLSRAMIAALQTELDRIADDRSVRVVILAAAGKGFSAGHDLREMLEHAGDEPWQQDLFGECSRMMVDLTRLPQPVIARVHGIATAAGCQLVSMCDLAVASENATFALPGVNIGVFCSTPAVGVGRNINRKRAMEMLLTGELVDAPTALAWGLVNRVVPADALDAAVRHFTDIVKARSAATIAVGKQAFYAQIEQPIAAAYDATSGVMACNMQFDDASEGIDAFLGKRTPVFRGR